MRASPQRKAWCAAVAAILLRSSDASASDASLALTWITPDGCPSGGDVSDRVREILRESGEPRKPIDAKVFVTHEATEWRADIHLDGGVPRTIQGESCDALANAIALIVAFAVQHEPNAPAPPAPPPSTEKSVSPAPAVAAKSEFLVGAAFALGTGLLPSADLGPNLVAGWNARHLRIALTGGITTKVKGRTTLRPEEGATFWLARAGAQACYTFLDSPFVVGPCTGLEIDRIAADGFGTPHAPSTTVLVLVPFGGVLARLRISGPLYLNGSLDGALPLSPPSFSVEGTGMVHKVSALSIRSAFGVEAHF